MYTYRSIPSSIFFLKKLKRLADGDSVTPKFSSGSEISLLLAVVIQCDVLYDIFGDPIVDITVLDGENEGDGSKDGEGFELVERAVK